MIVKVDKYEDLESVSPEYQQIYGNVTKTYKFMDKRENQFLEIYIKGQEHPELVPITETDKDGNHPALVSGIWLMNDEGKTIERII